MTLIFSNCWVITKYLQLCMKGFDRKLRFVVHSQTSCLGVSKDDAKIPEFLQISN